VTLRWERRGEDSGDLEVGEEDADGLRPVGAQQYHHPLLALPGARRTCQYASYYHGIGLFSGIFTALL
jgi:hypothetical protein